MTDRELLELAAKAAGGQVRFDLSPDEAPWLQGVVDDRPQPYPVRWNPLTDDGDALRLAVRCAHLFGFYRFLRAWLVAMATENGNPADPYAATRRAIVRAAAELGRSMT